MLPCMADHDALIATAQAWIADDPDPQTVQELTDLVAAVQSGDAAAAEELADAFDGTLQFGTAACAARSAPAATA